MVDLVDSGVDFHDILTENLHEFSRYLLAEDYVDYLVENSVLSVDDRELILNRFTNQTRRQRAVKLIEVLMTRGPTGYKKFMELLEFQCSHLYEKITKKQARKPPPAFQKNRTSDRLRLINELPNLAQHIKEQFTNNLELNTQLSFLQTLLELSNEEKSELEKEIDGLKTVQQNNVTLQSRIVDLQKENSEQQSRMNNVMQRCLTCTEERDKYREKCEWLQLNYDSLYKSAERQKTANTKREVDNVCEAGDYAGAASSRGTTQTRIWNQATAKSRFSIERPAIPPKPQCKLEMARQWEEHHQARHNIMTSEIEEVKDQCEDIAQLLAHAEAELFTAEQMRIKSQGEVIQIRKTAAIFERQLLEASAKQDSYFKTIQGKCNDIAELHAEREKEATRLKEVTRENTEMREHIHELEKESDRLKWQLEMVNVDEAAGNQESYMGVIPQVNELEDKVDTRQNVRRDVVIGSLGNLLADADGDVDANRDAPFIPNTSETAEMIFNREVEFFRTNRRMHNKFTDSTNTNASMIVQPSLKRSAKWSEGVMPSNTASTGLCDNNPAHTGLCDNNPARTGLCDSNLSSGSHLQEMELDRPASISRVPASHPADSDENGDDPGNAYIRREPRPPHRNRSQNSDYSCSGSISSGDSCFSINLPSHDVYTVLLPSDPVPVQEPTYPRLMLRHVTVKFPILEDKLVVCGGNLTGIFISKVLPKCSADLLPGDEIKEIRYKPNEGAQSVKAVLSGASLEDATKLLSNDFIRPKKEREIKLGISRNSHAYDSARRWMVSHHDTGDYLFIRCNIAVDCKGTEEISLKPGDIFLVKNSCYDNKHWSGYKVKSDTGQYSDEIQIIPNLQGAKYRRLPSTDHEHQSSLRKRGFRVKGATYDRVLPVKESMRLPVMVMGQRDLVQAMLAFIANQESLDFIVESADSDIADCDNVGIALQDCHVVRHGTFDQLTCNKHVQKIIILLYATSVPSQSDLSVMFGSDCSVCESTVTDSQNLQQKLTDMGHSFEEICFPPVNTSEELWKNFKQCVSSSQDRIVWLNHSEMDGTIANQYQKFLSHTCDLLQIASTIHTAQSFDDN